MDGEKTYSTKDASKMLRVKRSRLAVAMYDERVSSPTQRHGLAYRWTLGDIRHACRQLLRRDPDTLPGFPKEGAE